MDQAWLLTRYLPTKHAVHEVQNIPSWSAVNAKLENQPIIKTSIGYLPLWDSSPTDYSTVYTVMSSLVSIMDHLGQKDTVITFDQAIYKVAKEIQWQRADEFDHTVIRMGGFHIILNFMGALGKMCDSAGLRELLVESGLYSETTASNIMKGKQYNRGIRAHKLILEALFQCLWSNVEDDEEIAGALDEISGLADECSRSWDEDRVEFESCFKKLQECLHNIDGRLGSIEAQLREKSMLASFWLNYMDSVYLMLSFIRAERAMDWDLHLEAVEGMAPYFFCYDRQNYARWITVYMSDMKLLPSSSPDVHREFKQGNFAVTRSDHPFTAVWSDMALEQSLNRDVKVSGGLNHITKRESARNRWFITNHTLSVVVSEVSKMSGSDRAMSKDKHHEDTKSRTRADTEAVNKLVGQIRSMRDPFSLCSSAEEQASEKLSNIATGATPTVPDAEAIVNATARGKVAFDDFVEQRLRQPGKGFYEPVKRMNVPPFVKKKKRKATAREKLDSATNDRALFGRLVMIADCRKFDKMKLFHYELSDYPLSIADGNGSLRKAVKAQMLHEIEAEISGDIQLDHISESDSAVIIDGMALVQKMKFMGATKFSEYSDLLLRKVEVLFRSHDRVDIVFDRYDGRTSIKEGERQKRGATLGGEFIIHSGETAVPKSWTAYMSNWKNKVNLQTYLVQDWTARMPNRMQGEKRLYIGGGGTDHSLTVMICPERISVVDGLRSDHEEADTRMIIHAGHAFKSQSRVTIQSPDTDVFLLMIHHWRKMKIDGAELWFQTGTGLKERMIPIHRCVNRLFIEDHLGY